MDSRAQITIYILTGISILLLASLLISLQKPLPKQPPITTAQEIRNAIQTGLNSCTQQSLRESIFQLGQGGRIYPEENTIQTDEIVITPYYNQGRDETPSIQELENDLTYFIAEEFAACADQLKLPYSFVLSEDADHIETTIGENAVLTTITWPVRITPQSQEIIVNTFSASEPSSLLHMYKTAHDIVQKIIATQHEIDVTSQIRTPYELSFLSIDNNTATYLITDYEHTINQEPYEYIFGVQLG